jgi:hypothetical protein
MIVRLKARVVRGRLVMEVDGVPTVMGHFVYCPRCNAVHLSKAEK